MRKRVKKFQQSESCGVNFHLYKFSKLLLSQHCLLFIFFLSFPIEFMELKVGFLLTFCCCVSQTYAISSRHWVVGKVGLCFDWASKVYKIKFHFFQIVILHFKYNIISLDIVMINRQRLLAQNFDWRKHPKAQFKKKLTLLNLSIILYFKLSECCVFLHIEMNIYCHNHIQLRGHHVDLKKFKINYRIAINIWAKASFQQNP